MRIQNKLHAQAFISLFSFLMMTEDASKRKRMSNNNKMNQQMKLNNVNK